MVAVRSGSFSMTSNRAESLCLWIHENGLGGPGWGIEGIVRMSAGFELIFCDMRSPSLRLISYVNVTVPLNEKPLNHTADEVKLSPSLQDGASAPESSQSATEFPLLTLTQSPAPVFDPSDPTQDPDWRLIPREPFQWQGIWQWYNSITWHWGRSNVGPGRRENRVKIESCNLVSLYSPAWATLTASRDEEERKRLNLTANGHWEKDSATDPSVALKALSRRRRQHTLAAVSQTDALAVRQATKQALEQFTKRKRNPRGSSCSDMDWNLLTNSIAQRYTNSLDTLVHVLFKWASSFGNEKPVANLWMDAARDHLHSLLLPFFEYPALDKSEELHFETPRSQAAYSRCRSSWTRLLAPDQGISLSENEKLLKWAVEETLAGICSVILVVGIDVEGAWRAYHSRARKGGHEHEADALKLKVLAWTSKLE